MKDTNGNDLVSGNWYELVADANDNAGVIAQFNGETFNGEDSRYSEEYFPRDYSKFILA